MPFLPRNSPEISLKVQLKPVLTMTETTGAAVHRVLTFVRHSAECFAHIISFHPHNNLLRAKLLHCAEATKAQRSQVTFPRSHSCGLVEAGLKLKPVALWTSPWATPTLPGPACSGLPRSTPGVSPCRTDRWFDPTHEILKAYSVPGTLLGAMTTPWSSQIPWRTCVWVWAQGPP